MKRENQINPQLMNAAKVAINDALKVKKDEKVLIITNPEEDVSEISQALYWASNSTGAKTVLVYQDTKDQLSFAEECVIGSIGAEPDVLISMSHDKLGKDRKAISEPFVFEGKTINNTFHYLMKSRKTRSFWSPSTTLDIFINMVPVDYARMKREALWVKDIFDRAVSIRITASGGTDVTIGVRNRLGMLDDGDFSLPGSGGNLPAGETFISPEVGSAEGIIVFDGSISSHNGIIIIEEPIKVEYKNGFAVSVTGGKEAEELLTTITLAEENALIYEKEGKLPEGTGEAYKKNARSLGELGIGLNPAASITGNMLGDEKVYETCHFAIGSNYDDDAEALIHLDGLVLKPTITAFMEDGTKIVVTREGKLGI